ncbi:putative receptor protein kinase zmpk1 [Quercus suber]|uniref:Receptor protein kinase zmpk1 n=1 Tax=Quercus suber TaxID=58331 RepID=A0AAW0KGA4_QUESU
MANIILFLFSFALFTPFSSSTFQTLSNGSSLSSEKPEDILTSPNDVFSASFYSVGENAFCFAIWFSNSCTIFTIWTTNTFSLSLVQLSLYNTGNLILRNRGGVILWQRYDFPTYTLLPEQLLTKNTKIFSSRSQTNYSSGFY